MVIIVTITYYICLSAIIVLRKLQNSANLGISGTEIASWSQLVWHFFLMELPWRSLCTEEKRSINVDLRLWSLRFTIQKNFLIWIARSFKKEASDNTISYFDQTLRFSGLWLILARNLGRSGQNKLWGTENRERTNNSFC